MLYRIALSRIKGMNKSLAQHIHETVESLDLFFSLPENQLRELTGISSRMLQDDIRREAMQKAPSGDGVYPKGETSPRSTLPTRPTRPRLAECVDAPPLLYYRGSADLNAAQSGECGRHPQATEYGRSFCESTGSRPGNRLSPTDYRERAGLRYRHLCSPCGIEAGTRHGGRTGPRARPHLPGQPPKHSHRDGLSPRWAPHRVSRLSPHAPGLLRGPQPHRSRIGRRRGHRRVARKGGRPHHGRYCRELSPRRLCPARRYSPRDLGRLQPTDSPQPGCSHHLGR